MNNDNRMTAEERKATWGLGAIFSLRMFGMFMVLPVLTTYGMHLQGANETLIGIAIGIYGFMQAIFQIPFGLWSDKIERKTLIIFGLLIFVIGSVVAALSTSIWGVIIGRALQGSGAISAAVMALLSDLTREQTRTKAMAFIGVSFGITFAVAMVVGPIITHQIGLQGLFWFIAVLAVSGIILTITIIPKSQNHIRNSESAVVKGCLKDVLKQPQLLKLNIGIFCMHCLLMATFIALPLCLERAGFPAYRHWQIYLVTMLIAFVSVIPGIIIAEVKRKMRTVFLCCIVILITAEATLWQAHNQLWVLIGGTLLFFIAFNLMEALLPSLISKEAPAGSKGTAMGIYSTFQFFGAAVGGSVGGWIAEHEGTMVLLLSATLMACLWLIFAFTMKEPPYLANLRIQLMDYSKDKNLTNFFLQQTGVHEAIIIPEEQCAYIKIDSTMTNRQNLEAALAERKI
ncbi:MFS transporter [Gallibacterium melopsittaci]|uniref:MFS transporter n=1 Tax=Gallibacterium melopsittaci TaxID=516063 RepID=A0ABV6HX47_9PAST